MQNAILIIWLGYNSCHAESEVTENFVLVLFGLEISELECQLKKLK